MILIKEVVNMTLCSYEPRLTQVLAMINMVTEEECELVNVLGDGFSKLNSVKVYHPDLQDYAVYDNQKILDEGVDYIRGMYLSVMVLSKKIGYGNLYLEKGMLIIPNVHGSNISLSLLKSGVKISESPVPRVELNVVKSIIEQMISTANMDYNIAINDKVLKSLRDKFGDNSFEFSNVTHNEKKSVISFTVNGTDEYIIFNDKLFKQC